MLRVRKAIRELPFYRQAQTGMDGDEIEARWDEMIATVNYETRERERRLERAERALNQVALN